MNQAFRVHYVERYWRVIYRVCTFVFTTGVLFFYKRERLVLYLKQLAFVELGERPSLIATDVSEAFQGYLYACVCFGLILSRPIVLYHRYAFLRSGLHEVEEAQPLRRTRWARVFCSILGHQCAEVGLGHAYAFFIGFGGQDTVRFQGKFDSFVSFHRSVFRTAYRAFAFPLVLYWLIRQGILSFERASKVLTRKLVLCGVLCVAALCTPPDVLSQLVCTLPLILFYEGVLLLLLVQKSYAESEGEETVVKEG